jgi:Ser-tRNA(Ala) deacylase AlaX
MTERLYYNNSFLHDFVAALMERRTLADGRAALVLDRTAFYPTSGGQVFDTGWLELEPLETERGQFLPKLHVVEVAETDDGEILHIVDEDGASTPLPSADSPTRVRGFIDVDRRRDHMQQHSGQHVLSAAFVELFQMPTVSFHMGEQSCTIDLETKGLSAAQVRQAEARANQVIWEDRPVTMQMATRGRGARDGSPKDPRGGARKAAPCRSIQDFDLCACGGTHVRATGQIGTLLIRKTEKVKQGVRVEFVCGERAVRHARKDYETLTETAARFPRTSGSSRRRSRSRWRNPAPQPSASTNSWSASRNSPQPTCSLAPPKRRVLKLVAQVLPESHARLRKAARAEAHRRGAQRSRAAWRGDGPGGAGLRAVAGPSQRHGRADEGLDGLAWRAWRRLARHGPGRRSQMPQSSPTPLMKLARYTEQAIAANRR